MTSNPATTRPTLPLWPQSPAPSRLEWNLLTRTQSFTSPLTGQTQTISLPAAKWQAILEYELYGEDNIRNFTNFILSLEGPKTRFLFIPPHAQTPKGNAKNNTAIAPKIASEQKQGFIQVKEWGAGATSPILKAGDYITIKLKNGQYSMHSITEDVAIGSAAQTNVKVTPQLRNVPETNSKIFIHSPFCVMRLKDDSQTSFSMEKVTRIATQFELIESFS